MIMNSADRLFIVMQCSENLLKSDSSSRSFAEIVQCAAEKKKKAKSRRKKVSSWPIFSCHLIWQAQQRPRTKRMRDDALPLLRVWHLFIRYLCYETSVTYFYNILNFPYNSSPFPLHQKRKNYEMFTIFAHYCHLSL